MKKIAFFSLAMCTTLAIVWGIFALALAEVASDNSKKAEQHFEKAVERIRQLMYDDAIAEFEKVVTLVPESKIAHDAQYWIGQAYFRAGQFDDALSTFEKLIHEYPESAIIPVTQLMVGRVQLAKDNEKLKRTASNASDSGVIIDPETSVKYTRVKTFAGKRDVIEWNTGLNLSPNSKFLLWNELVIPLDDREPFELVDIPASRGTWSPDGRKAAFYSKDAIWVVPVSPETGQSTGPPRKLLDGKYRYQPNVSWSPDGEKLIFRREDDEVSGDIWTLSVKDGALTQITDDPLSEYDPAWSPDGKTIAYGKYRRNIWLVTAEGEKPRKIIDDGRHVSWSPDGKWLLFYKVLKPHLFRIADERVFEIIPPDGVGDFFSWSPDGKKMLFYRPSYDYTCILKVVSASGGPSFQLGRDLELWPYVHFWSPDSKMIITDGGYPIDLKYKDNLAFLMIPLAGSDAIPLELDVSVDGKPHPRSLSPGCEKLLFFVKQGDGKEDLYVAPVSLEDARTTGPAVMVFSGRDKKPVGYGKIDEWSWSPDGSKLAVIHGGDIWITSAEEGKPVQITKTPEDETFPVWSPDGGMIAYIVNTGEGEQILEIISVSGGEAKEIFGTSAHRDRYAWSPDGKEIAVVSKGMISAITIAGGKARQILDLKHREFVEDRAWGLSWLPDGKHLAFIGQKVVGNYDSTRIFMVSAEGGKVTELAADDKDLKNWLYPSPDGKWISYDSEGEVKTRAEGTLWEADFEEILEKLPD